MDGIEVRERKHDSGLVKALYSVWTAEHAFRIRRERHACRKGRDNSLCDYMGILRSYPIGYGLDRQQNRQATVVPLEAVKRPPQHQPTVFLMNFPLSWWHFGCFE